ncbi:MAG: NUDIX hydrolase [bacterium]
MTWKKLSSKQVYQNRFMTVTEEELVTNGGDKVTFGIVHKEPAVIIIPFDGEKFTLIRQYRYPVDFDSWEFPAGHMEHGSVIETAKVELEEEAGIIAEHLKEIGTFHIAPGHLTQVCHVFLATGLILGHRHLEIAEKGMKIGHFSHAEINEMIREGEIKDGLTISALTIFDLYP